MLDIMTVTNPPKIIQLITHASTRSLIGLDNKGRLWGRSIYSRAKWELLDKGDYLDDVAEEED